MVVEDVAAGCESFPRFGLNSYFSGFYGVFLPFFLKKNPNVGTIFCHQKKYIQLTSSSAISAVLHTQKKKPKQYPTVTFPADLSQRSCILLFCLQSDCKYPANITEAEIFRFALFVHGMGTFCIVKTWFCTDASSDCFH